MKQNSLITESTAFEAEDHEADMARSELYKLAEYAVKLFHMIEPGSNLEGWTAAKITKASDYISSVYHYMQYEQKFGDEPEQAPEEEAVQYEESIKKNISSSLLEEWQKRKQG
jgi:hypothetical protein